MINFNVAPVVGTELEYIKQAMDNHCINFFPSLSSNTNATI